jgi:hypothetical protein
LSKKPHVNVIKLFSLAPMRWQIKLECSNILGFTFVKCVV